MKKLILMGATLAFAGLAIAPSQAQTQTTATSTTTTSGYVQSSKIIGSKIRSADGSEIGVIKDVVLDRDTGCMAYTVLETTGAANVASSSGAKTTTTTTTRKTVAMPWTAVRSTNDPTIYTTQIQRERIYSAPAYDYGHIDQYSRPEYISGVYSYYGVQPAVGVNIGISSTSRGGANIQAGSGASTNATPTSDCDRDRNCDARGHGHAFAGSNDVSDADGHRDAEFSGNGLPFLERSSELWQWSGFCHAEIQWDHG